MARELLLAEADRWDLAVALAMGRDVEENEPTTYFFYGTLMDPTKLQSVLKVTTFDACQDYRLSCQGLGPIPRLSGWAG
jgi:hypothetical protein